MWRPKDTGDSGGMSLWDQVRRGEAGSCDGGGGADGLRDRPFGSSTTGDGGTDESLWTMASWRAISTGDCDAVI